MTAAPAAARRTQLRALVSDTVAVGALSVAARVAGGVKTIAGAGYFPPGPALDAWLLAFLIPSFLGDVLAGSIGPALIPALGENGHEQTYAAALHRTVRWFGLLALAVMLAAILTPAAIGPRWQAARPMLLVMVPLIPLMGVNAVWRSVLHARLHFRAAAFAPLLTPLLTIACLPLAPRFGGMALALGTTLGMLAEAAFLASALFRQHFLLFPPRVGRALPPATFARTRRQYAALVAGSVMLRGSAAVDQAAAAMLGAGALSFLNYGTRLSTVLLAIGPAAIGATLMPRYAQAIASGRTALLRKSLVATLAVAGGLAAAVVAALIWGSEPLTRLALLHGAFTAADAHQVSKIQVFSLLQLPFATAVAILSGLVASLKANHSMLPFWAAAVAGHAALDFYFLKPLGVRGIALSTTIVQGLMVCGLVTVVLPLMRKSD
jgi:putative peptidoglycan lipid II flippase